MLEKIVKDILAAAIIALIFLPLIAVFSEYLMAVSSY